ncbi:hypothetical protein [Deinococcus aestuarii]|uniref:hypothetical protein n=1 Tax=Deinococcus aestuarii TaxID=2774531 RepID=UPI001C0BF4F2|nr:hypothetical protein [Deinococcus aestuarii]
MANPADRPKIPKYVNAIPEGMATIEQLRAAGLKPGTLRPVALYAYEEGDRRGLCGLFERSAAVPLPNPSETA